MLRDLFVNSCILVTFIFTGSLVLQKRVIEQHRWRNQVLFGLVAGGMGIVLMQFSVRVTATTILDMRHLAVVLAAIFAGPGAAMTTAVVLAIARILLFGGLSPSSELAASTMLLIGLGCVWLTQRSWSSWRKFTIMNVYGLSVVSVTLYLLVRDWAILRRLYVFYWIFGLLMGALTTYLTLYVLRVRALYFQLEEYSTKDFLTGLNNVRKFDEVFNEMMNQAQVREEQLSLLLLDIDHFKQINDTYGHPGGDQVLRDLGHVLARACRSFDVVSRNGGEEFTMLLPDCSHEQACEVAERVRRMVEKHLFRLPAGGTIRISVSIGVATYSETAQTQYEVYQQADDALYSAKRLGRNRVISAQVRSRS
ncbi:GGDEF domain-containing protein [Tumebacillus permanentifrigoris]|uniref:Diguanylate cyclase n=1 Tax=Tumebacillus permanentifrigoris TaxID=378543 RepID=A0A316DDJ3_9BACL|nr:diguanylate cyclase [Tumebacillus permanentifrigoris]PWK15602.1 diguanylate cyclase [Tumebacillus permanentifrigoris]